MAEQTSDQTFTVALTGASGCVGGHVLSALLKRGHGVRALIRSPQSFTRPSTGAGSLEVIEGELADAAACEQLVDGADAVVHLVGIIDERGAGSFHEVHVEGTRSVLSAATAAGIDRWVQMSALGAREDARSRYHQTKYEAEQLVREQMARWTILRPSIIHGPDGEFMQMVRDFWVKLFPPFVPYFGAGPAGLGGAGRLQPVWVEDVATVAAESLTRPIAEGQVYPMGGPDRLTWPQLYRLCRDHFPDARNKPIVAVPVWYANLIAGMPGVPFNRDQVIMSQEDSICATGKFEEHFEMEAAPFEPTLADYADRM